jgi:peptidoglycan/xylan/chitin deacetylase (PgdA/CDA1 family)
MSSAESIAAPLLKLAATICGRGRQRLAVLHYHRVCPERDPLFPDNLDPATFEAQIRVVNAVYSVLPLGEAIRRLYRGELPDRALSITFDDGYADNFSVALPILRAQGLPATFFIASGYMNGGTMWNDRIILALRRLHRPVDLRPLGLPDFPPSYPTRLRDSLDDIVRSVKYRASEERERIADQLVALSGSAPLPRMMMTPEEVRQLADAGMEIGAHTVTHPILAQSAPDVAEVEISRSKIQLEAITGRPVELFAYPNGRPGVDYLPLHVDIVRRVGFKAAVTTAWGCATRETDPMEIPRVAPWDRSSIAFAGRIALSYR